RLDPDAAAGTLSSDVRRPRPGRRLHVADVRLGRRARGRRAAAARAQSARGRGQSVSRAQQARHDPQRRAPADRGRSGDVPGASGRGAAHVRAGAGVAHGAALFSLLMGGPEPSRTGVASLPPLIGANVRGMRPLWKVVTVPSVLEVYDTEPRRIPSNLPCPVYSQARTLAPSTGRNVDRLGQDLPQDLAGEDRIGHQSAAPVAPGCLQALDRLDVGLQIALDALKLGDAGLGLLALGLASLDGVEQDVHRAVAR